MLLGTEASRFGPIVLALPAAGSQALALVYARSRAPLDTAGPIGERFVG